MDSNIKQSTLLHPLGHKMVMLGGDVFDQRVTGDMISEYKWVDGEPVMLIYKNTLGRNSKAYMLELKDAYMFANANGTASRQLVQEFCHDAARALGCEHDKASVFRIIDIILNGLPDLLMMPPEPKAHELANRPAATGDELKVTMDGKTIVDIGL